MENTIIFLYNDHEQSIHITYLNTNLSITGNADSGWILLDYGDVMCHVMTPKSRLFYDMEGQWRDKGGEEMDLSNVLLPDATIGNGDDAKLGGSMDGISMEDDPFWS